jgi:hypothetical protein
MCNQPNDEAAFSVVSDANFLFYLLEALVNAVENDYPDRPRDEMFEPFMERLNRVLEGVSSRARDGRFLIPRRVYDEEVCPTNSTSSLRTKLGCIETMCQRRDDKYRRLEQCLLRHLIVADEHDQNVRFLMQYFHDELRPKDRDASLLLLALRKSAGIQTYLLTDDQGLIKACEHIIRKGQVVIACGTFATQGLARMGYMDFVKWAHDACFIDTDQFACCFSFRLAIEHERLEKVGPSGRRLRVKEFDKATYAYRRSVVMKRQPVQPQPAPQAL